MMQARFSRRDLMRLAASGAVVSSLAGCATVSDRPLGRVVVVGGGFSGATAAKYLRIWSEGRIDVSLVEPHDSFVSCPMSNLVIGGSKQLKDITVPYSGLAKYGVRVVKDSATRIDAEGQRVLLASGASLPYDRLVLSPGVEFMFESIEGMTADAAATVPHAWRAGPQTQLLRDQLVAMPDGGTVLMSIPAAPYRCPPGPYERACQIAHYLKHAKPRSKLVVLDANADIVSKKALFLSVWNKDYKGLIEYRANAAVTEVDLRGRRFVTEFGDRLQGQVLNLIPPQRAGNIARDAGVITTNKRWCDVDWTSLESMRVKNIHVTGDSTMAAPAMPKSGHMANQHGKAAAAAIVELMNGRQPMAPMMANTCYSYIDAVQAVHVTSVHRYIPEKRTMETIPGSGGLSAPERTHWATEGDHAWSWAEQIWADMLA